MDWNYFVGEGYYKPKVEAYVASWIEIYALKKFGDIEVVEAYVASWIEI